MVRHILKDGTEVESVSGRVLKISEFTELYNIIRAINRKIENEQPKKGEKNG